MKPETAHIKENMVPATMPKNAKDAMANARLFANPYL